jgi:hypothetical protein
LIDKANGVLLYEKPITPTSGVVRLFSFETGKIVDVFSYNGEKILNIATDKAHSFNVITDKAEYSIYRGQISKRVEKIPSESFSELPWWKKTHISPDNKKSFELYFEGTEISLTSIPEHAISFEGLEDMEYKGPYSLKKGLKYKDVKHLPYAIPVEVFIKGPGLNKRVSFKPKVFFYFSEGEGSAYLTPDFELKWSEDSKSIVMFIYHSGIDRVLKIAETKTIWCTEDIDIKE